MRISIKNCGPVNKAEIDLKDLIVFVGPNNSGKSFVAALMYASLSQTGVATSVGLARSIRRTSGGDDRDKIGEIVSFFVEAMPTKKLPPYELLPPEVNEYFSSIVRESLTEYAVSVAEEISRTAGVPLVSIRRVARKRAVQATIEIISGDPTWRVRITIKANSVEIDVEPPNFPDLWSRLDIRQFPRYARSGSLRTPTPSSIFMREISANLVQTCFREVPQHSKYLPAARSGILQSHKALAGSIVRRSTLAGIEDLRVPAMSGVVTDFLSEMIELDPTEHGTFQAEAKSLEDEILHGQIGLPGEPSGYPEVVYTTPSGSYPLGRTSSMVSELAPVVLYLRHRLRRGDLLFIEEPEAHLHPATQIVFAQRLIGLVNKGLRIVLTTHSEFFLQQLNNAIVAGDMNQAEIAKAGVPRELSLKSAGVTAYYFSPTPSGTVVSNMQIDTKEGINESSFGDVAEHLYNEAVALDRSEIGAEK